MPSLKERIEAGGRIDLGAGRYRITETIVINKPTHIHGDHCDLCIIDVAPGVTAFRVEMGGQRSIFRDFTLEGEGVKKITTPTFGIETFVAIYVERVTMRDFVTGVRARANVHVDGNANRGKILHSMFQGMDAQAVYLDGPDVNSWNLIGLSALNTCERAGYWQVYDDRLRAEALAEAQRIAREKGEKEPAEVPYPVECVGVKCAFGDSSFLGCAWFGCMSDRPIDLTTSKRYPAFIHDGKNSHSVFFGSYQESGAPSVVSQTGVAIGGIGAWTGDGYHRDGYMANGTVYRNAQDPKNVTLFRLGNKTRAGAFFGAFAEGIDGARGLELDANLGSATTPKLEKQYRFRIAGTGFVLTIEQGGAVRFGKIKA